MALKGAPIQAAPWERRLREVTEVIRRGLVHLGNAEAVLARTGDTAAVNGEFNAAMDCDRQARRRMDPLMAELEATDQKRLVAQAASKGTIKMLMQSFLLYRMTLGLVIHAQRLGARGDQCAGALRLAKEFAASSMALIRDTPHLRQGDLLEAVQNLNDLNRDFDDRFAPVFDRIAHVHNRLVPDDRVTPIRLAEAHR